MNLLIGIKAYQVYALINSIDGEWGVSMRIDSTTLFPWAMTLGAVGDDNLLYEMGKEIANQCRFLGIHMIFAPVVDVNNNPKNPIIEEDHLVKILS